MILKALNVIFFICIMIIIILSDVYIINISRLSEKQVVYLLGYVLSIFINFTFTILIIIPLLKTYYNRYIQYYTNYLIKYEDAVIIFFIMQILTFMTVYSNEF